MSNNVLVLAALFLGSFVLVGCDTTPKPNLIKEVPKVFEPDPSLFKAPRLDTVPDPTTLTDGEVAELLLVLDEYNRVCWRSLQEVKEQIQDAKAHLEGE